MSPNTTGAPPAGGRGVLVIGAGIVGVCCALYLQREGFKVTLIDKDGPGEACSAVNAGGLGAGSCAPFSLPGLWRKVPGMLSRRLHPLSVPPGNFLSAMPWFIRFLLAGRRKRVDEIADALLTIVSTVFEAYEPLVAAAGAQDMIQHQGRLFVFTSRRVFESNRLERDIRRRGVEIEELDGDQAREIEPKLGPGVQHGAYQRINGHVVNPKRLVQVLAEHFALSGGTLLRQSVRGFETSPDGPPRVVTEAATHAADFVVIAAGAWSRALAAQLGTKVPMQAERGYFMMVPDPGLRGPVQWNDKLLALCPMEHGLRVSSGAEFTPVDAPPDYERAFAILRQAEDLIPGLEMRELERGMGSRPSMPDSMPVIGPCPGHPKVLFAFGHGHIGLTLGAVTGKLIGELAAGRPPSIDLAPFRPDRF